MSKRKITIKNRTKARVINKKKMVVKAGRERPRVRVFRLWERKIAVRTHKVPEGVMKINS